MGSPAERAAPGRSVAATGQAFSRAPVTQVIATLVADENGFVHAPARDADAWPGKRLGTLI
jgi:hypothetical protein